MHLLQELISKKRDGEALKQDEIVEFIQGVTAETVSDAQIAAFAMAVWFRGMDIEEQTALTLAMRDSGEVLAWKLDGPLLDKHSTGGVGDLVSLVLAPVIASCGAYVPMISGRGLGHTGGTLDKLESIPGFNTSLDIGHFQKLVQANGIAIIGQSRNLVPADRRIYAVRDLTATVSSVPLIVSSILSKKQAEGLDALVLDIKLGSGAFMRRLDDARQLAADICRVAGNSGLPCTAVITDMNEPLAWSAGNALEVAEAIEYLRGGPRHQRLAEVVEALASELLVLGGLAGHRADGARQVREAVDSGKAAEHFACMVAGQGGPTDLLENPEKYLPAAAVVKPVFAQGQGVVNAMDTHSLGFGVVELGGGRQSAGAAINPAVGLAGLCSVGQLIDPEIPLVTIHAASEADWQLAASRVRAAISLGDPAEVILPVVYERIEGSV